MVIPIAVVKLNESHAPFRQAARQQAVRAERAVAAAGPVEVENRLRLVASRSQDDGSLLIHTDARIYLGTIEAGNSVTHQLPPGRHAWLQVLRGAALLNGEPLHTGDGAAISDETSLTIEATSDAELMLFDLA